jgi:uncharacterized protein YjiS (DUF1127 family)
MMSLASGLHRAGWPGCGHDRAASLPAVIAASVAAWRGRMRFRGELEEMTKANPHLIEDIGLTRHEADREIAKRFWQR